MTYAEWSGSAPPAGGLSLSPAAGSSTSTSRRGPPWAGAEKSLLGDQHHDLESSSR